MNDEFNNMNNEFNDYNNSENADGQKSEELFTNAYQETFEDNYPNYEGYKYNTVSGETVDSNFRDDDIDFSHFEVVKAEKKSIKIVKKIGALVLSGLLFGSVAGGALYGTNYLLNKNKDVNASENVNTAVVEKDKITESKPVKKVELTKVDKDTNTDSDIISGDLDTLGVEEIVSNCLPCVVAITNVGVEQVQTLWGTYKQDSQSAGSGVIIAQTDDELIILTNYHVVKNSTELTCVFSFDEDSDEPTAVHSYLKGYDAERDVAVVAIKTDELTDEILDEVRIAVIGDSNELNLGEQVVAIGNALGYGQSVTTGIISALNRYVALDNSDGTKISNYYIQTDAAINPGNSGGALFTMTGELVGINSAKVSSSSVEGMGYAIPISDIEELVTDLMNMETKVTLAPEDQGYLCIGGSDVDSKTAQMYSVPQGVYVSAVYDGTAAANAGITEGDIITSINGITVKSMTELKTQLSYLQGGEVVEIKLQRFEDNGYKEKTFTVTLSTYEEFESLK